MHLDYHYVHGLLTELQLTLGEVGPIHFYSCGLEIRHTLCDLPTYYHKFMKVKYSVLPRNTFCSLQDHSMLPT